VPSSDLDDKLWVETWDSIDTEVDSDDGALDRRTDRQTDDSTLDRRTDRRTDGWTDDGTLDRQTDGRLVHSTDNRRMWHTSLGYSRD